MSSRHGQASHLRPATKARKEQSASSVPVPVPVKPASRHPRKTHGKKHAVSMPSSESHETPCRPRSHHQPGDFHSIGAWCGDIPERHYAPRISIGESRRAQCLPAAPTPPSVTPQRLNSPRPSLLAFDAEFGEAQLEKDDRVGDAWYLSRTAKTNRQLEEALAHIAQTRLLPQAE